MSFDAAVTRLADPQAARRRTAARRLADLGDPAACAALQAHLESEAAIPKAWKGQVEAAQALARCGCADAVPALRRLMVLDRWGSAATTAMAEAYVVLGTGAGDDLALVHECVAHGRFPLTRGAFSGMARRGLVATDPEVAALHAVCAEQQVDLQGANPHLDLRYPLGQAARRWEGPATDRLLADLRGSGVPELVEVAEAAAHGHLAGILAWTNTG